MTALKLQRWELYDYHGGADMEPQDNGSYYLCDDLAPILAIAEAAVAWVDCMKPDVVSPVGSLRKAAVALDEAVRAAREKAVL